MAPSPYSSLSSAAAGSPNDGPGDGPPAHQPDLDTLISHLVAAKRSLSSINHVWRANEIVTAARAALEESVVLSARTGFLRSGLDDQVRLLYDVKAEVDEVAARGRAEFSSALQELDGVDEQLRRTLDILRETTVEPAFRPADEPTKSLHGFVDERGVEDLQALLKDAIDNTNSAQTDLEASNAAFDTDLRSIRKDLSRYRKKTEASSQSLSSSSQSASRVNNAPTPSLFPELLRSLESHAQEMADLLQSLVRHYDLCVTAIKHTEGGGAAARNITGDPPAGVDVGDNNENTQDPHRLEPLSENEYQEMLAVLTKDATEAEDVVLEIQDRITEMESTLERVIDQRDLLVAASESATEIFHDLSKFASTKLPTYIAQTQTFTAIWKGEHERIQSGMADLTDLRSLYIGFLDAYDGLILEAARRKSVRGAVDKVLRDARTKLDKLYAEDMHARETFRAEQGDYLPSDIWPDLGRGPMKVEFKRVHDGDVKGEGEEEEEGQQQQQTQTQTPEGEGDVTTPTTQQPNDNAGDSIPDLPRQAVERALERVKMRGKKAPRIPR